MRQIDTTEPKVGRDRAYVRVQKAEVTNSTAV